MKIIPGEVRSSTRAMCRCCVVLLLLAASPSGVRAEDEVLPWIQVESTVHGISFFHPPDWKAKAIVGEAALFRFAGDDGGCSVHVAGLAPSASAVSDQENLPRLTAAFAPELLAPEPAIRFHSFRTEELQGLRGLNVVFDRPSRDVPGLVTREKFVAVARGDQGFAVRCSAAQQDFGDLEGVFDGVIVSMRWQEPPDGSTASAAPKPSAGAMARTLEPSTLSMRVAGWLAAYLLCAPLLALVARRRNRNPWAWGLVGGLAGPLSFVALFARPPLPPDAADAAGAGEARDETPSSVGGELETGAALYRALDDAGPVGLGGWLVLPLVGLILTIVGAGKALFSDILPVLRQEAWSHLTSPESPGYSILWAPYIVGSALMNLLLATGAIALLVLFLRRKASLPLLFSIFYGFAVLTTTFEGLSVHALASQFPDLFERATLIQAHLDFLRALATAAIWITYFRVSRRVKNTFVVP